MPGIVILSLGDPSWMGRSYERKTFTTTKFKHDKPRNDARLFTVSWRRSFFYHICCLIAMTRMSAPKLKSQADAFCPSSHQGKIVSLISLKP